jgi:oligopeptide/dipeptide ABC transporter ATP-binding protein
MMAGDVALEVRGLSVGYGGPDVVRSVDLVIHKGERVGLIGETGSGKSTLGLAILRLLASNGRITGGSVLLGGRDLVTLSPRELRRVRGREIALIYQDAAASLDPVKTIGAQLEEAACAHGGVDAKTARAGVLTALESVGIPTDRARSHPHELSGGMRQRVSIAMALVHQPTLVIADEPTTALDVTTQAQVLALLNERVTMTGAALMLITHDLGVVAGHCDTTVVLYGGRVVEHGPTDAVLSAPRHPYTEALVRSERALRDPGVDRLPVIPGAPPLPGEHAVGCPFAPRCPRRNGDPRCEQATPMLSAAGLDRQVACHHAAVGVS